MIETAPSESASAERLQRLIATHAPRDGTHETPLEGVRLFRVSAPVARVPGVYEPSVCAVASGTKHAYHDGQTHTYGPGNYLCTTMPTPLEAEIAHATVDEPVLGVLIDLTSRTATEFLIQHRAARNVRGDAVPAATGITVAPWDDPFTAALVHLLELLESAGPRELLATGRLRELLFAVAEGPAGPAIRATLGAPTHQLAPVLSYLRNHLDEPLTVEDLADRAGMSRASFDRHFRATTSLSPLQYLKALRLNDAAMLIAAGATITDAATRVGYTNPSHFSRDFKRHFGTTPRAWSQAESGIDPQAFVDVAAT